MIGYGSESGSYPLPQSKALRAYFPRYLAYEHGNSQISTPCAAPNQCALIHAGKRILAGGWRAALVCCAPESEGMHKSGRVDEYAPAIIGTIRMRGLGICAHRRMHG